MCNPSRATVAVVTAVAAVVTAVAAVAAVATVAARVMTAGARVTAASAVRSARASGGRRRTTMVTAHAASSAQPAAPAQPNSSAQTATLSPSSLSFVAGAISGAAGQAVGHPLDTLNIHAQAGRSTEHLRLWSLWRGASVPVMTVGSINSLALGVFENVRRALWPHESPTPLPVLAAAGTSCGLAVSVVTCPLSRVKILQQLTGVTFLKAVATQRANFGDPQMLQWCTRRGLQTMYESASLCVFCSGLFIQDPDGGRRTAD